MRVERKGIEGNSRGGSKLKIVSRPQRRSRK